MSVNRGAPVSRGAIDSYANFMDQWGINDPAALAPLIRYARTHRLIEVFRSRGHDISFADAMIICRNIGLGYIPIPGEEQRVAELEAQYGGLRAIYSTVRDVQRHVGYTVQMSRQYFEEFGRGNLLFDDTRFCNRRLPMYEVTEEMLAHRRERLGQLMTEETEYMRQAPPPAPALVREQPVRGSPVEAETERCYRRMQFIRTMYEERGVQMVTNDAMAVSRRHELNQLASVPRGRDELNLVTQGIRMRAAVDESIITRLMNNAPPHEEYFMNQICREADYFEFRAAPYTRREYSTVRATQLFRDDMRTRQLTDDRGNPLGGIVMSDAEAIEVIRRNAQLQVQARNESNERIQQQVRARQRDVRQAAVRELLRAHDESRADPFAREVANARQVEEKERTQAELTAARREEEAALWIAHADRVRQVREDSIARREYAYDEMIRAPRLSSVQSSLRARVQIRVRPTPGDGGLGDYEDDLAYRIERLDLENYQGRRRHRAYTRQQQVQQQQVQQQQQQEAGGDEEEEEEGDLPPHPVTQIRGLFRHPQ